MIIAVAKLEEGKTLSLSEDVSFDPAKYPLQKPLLDIVSCHVDAKVMAFDEFIEVIYHLEARVGVECSYTLERFEMNVHSDDDIRFSDRKDDADEEAIIYRGPSIDLTPNIFNVLCASIPLSPKKPGAVPPKSGDGYHVMTDEDLKKEKEEDGDPRFAKLKDLDL